MAGQRCYDQPSRDALRRWLARELNVSDNVLIKDPRLLWFAPLWRHVAEDLGARVRFVTMLRHPAEVVHSKETWYEDLSNPANRLTGWVNTLLYTERATRHDRRAYVEYKQIEAVAYSSVVAAHRYGMRRGIRRARQDNLTGLRRVIEVVPPSWRDAVPIEWRRKVLQLVR
jgi:hypothetical protein